MKNINVKTLVEDGVTTAIVTLVSKPFRALAENIYCCGTMITYGVKECIEYTKKQKKCF